MSRENFTTLLKEYGELLGLEHIDPVFEGAPIIIEGVSFSFAYNEEASHLFHVYCDLGPADPKKRADIYRKLLVLNLNLYFLSNEALMVSPETGHVMLASSFSLESTKALVLQKLIDGLCKTVIDLKWINSFEYNKN